MMPKHMNTVNQLEATLNQAVVGQESVVRSILIGLLSGGHVLLEGLPGTAKTRSVKALADNLGLAFSRIQFTPDLLPSDVTGSEVYNEVDGKPQLSFKPGPIFNSIVLADEINRAPAKVQAALLEAMAEGTLTAAGQTLSLPQPFMVLATQNPIEQEGTYPLPEAQMDRFLMKLVVDYPDAQAELDIIRLVRQEDLDTQESTQVDGKDGVSSVTQSLFIDHVLAGKEQVKALYVSENIERYIVDIIMATRKPMDYPESNLSQWITVGASPRASIALDRTSRAHAWLNGEAYVTPDDVRSVIHSVLGHRISLSFDALTDGVTSHQVIDEILDHVVLT